MLNNVLYDNVLG